MDSLIGQLAALLAAIGFGVTSVCYTFAGRKVNAVTSIALSLPIAWLLLVGIHQIAQGEFFPTTATPARWLHLSASGILAFVISSYFMLNAYQHIGPRLTMLIGSSTPLVSALLAWLFLGQTLPADAAIGIALVTFGIVWVVAERHPPSPGSHAPDRRRGVILASLGMLAQAAAFIFASLGISGGYSPFSATLIRITAGVLTLWAYIALQGKLGATASSLRHHRWLFLQLTGAALTGPVIAGALLLVALQLIPLGVATTLSHTTSIFLIPVGALVFGERITPRAVIGTLVSIIGIAILFT